MSCAPDGSAGAPAPGDATVDGTDRPADRQALKDALQNSLDEARMVLPGIQTLFGFQLVVVFNPRFDSALDRPLQMLHLGALVLAAVSAALVMTPAAYHRQSNGSGVSPRLLRIVSGFVSAAMVPLMTALSLDVYLVARVVLGAGVPAAVVGGCCSRCSPGSGSPSRGCIPTGACRRARATEPAARAPPRPGLPAGEARYLSPWGG